MATAADWMSAASFISMAGIISFNGRDGAVYLMAGPVDTSPAPLYYNSHICENSGNLPARFFIENVITLIPQERLLLSALVVLLTWQDKCAEWFSVSKFLKLTYWSYHRMIIVLFYANLGGIIYPSSTVLRVNICFMVF
jgi:cation/acetate symporter